MDDETKQQIADAVKDAMSKYDKTNSAFHTWLYAHPQAGFNSALAGGIALGVLGMWFAGLFAK